MAALTDIQSEDLLNLMCGEKLGAGQYRTTFVCLANKTQVIKLDNMQNFSNIAEWDMWKTFEDEELGKWLAPCYTISPHGIWLVQARTEPIPQCLLPTKVPEIFADIKRSNWGMFEGRPVCHDYGNHSGLRLSGKSGKKMMEVDWSRE